MTPATPADAAGLLVQAIRSDDPVLFFDPKDLFWANGEIAEPIEPIPFGVARRVSEGDAAVMASGRNGDDPALVNTWGNDLHFTGYAFVRGYRQARMPPGPPVPVPAPGATGRARIRAPSLAGLVTCPPAGVSHVFIAV